MLKQIHDVVKNLPSDAGVYQYYGADGKLLYVGKAKNLRNRVRSYFKFTPEFRINEKLSYRIVKMLGEADNINYIKVKNEFDALVLENSLIKQLNPKYNILLRDDKTYPYLYIDYSDPFPRIEITRKIFKNRKNIKYYGPFTVGISDILKSLYDIFTLVQKKNCINSKKECLFYHIKMCKAPCVGKIDPVEYEGILKDALHHLQNRNLLIDKLKIKMQSYAENLKFEEAMNIRERIELIKKVSFDITTDLKNGESFDVVTVTNSDSKAVVVRMFFREGKLISSDYEYVKVGDSFDIDELYERAIVNMYLNKSYLIPSQILVSYEFTNIGDVSKMLTEHFDKNIGISVPKIGKKRDLVNMCEINGKELLKNNTTEKKDMIKGEITALLGLSREPEYIETIDNSHLAGSAPVGGIVAFRDNSFYKAGYRHYHLNATNEYEQMRETLTIRAKHFVSDSPPDLFVLDGGATLLKLAVEIFTSFGIGSDVIAISKEKIDFKAHRAKGKARDIIYTTQNSYRLEPSDKRLQFVQRLRDEAHRFAITFHKKSKIKNDNFSQVLSSNGIGPAKVKKLIDYFGTFAKIKEASRSELLAVLSSRDVDALLQTFNSALEHNILK